MAKINISQDGPVSQIEVDGVRLKGVLEANVMLAGGKHPTVEIRLHMGAGGMDLADGCLKVGALDAPEALERALLAHLKAKFENGMDRLLALPVRTMGVDPGAGDDKTAVTVVNNLAAPVVVSDRNTDGRTREVVVEHVIRTLADPQSHFSAALVPQFARGGPVKAGQLAMERDGTELFKPFGTDRVQISDLRPGDWSAGPTPEDPMQAVRALAKKHGGGSGG